MAITQSGNDILVDNQGANLSAFLDNPNVKTQNGTISTITTGPVGTNANGSIILKNESGAVLNLESNHTYIMTNARLQNSANGNPVDNCYINAKGAKIVFVQSTSRAEQIAPIKGDNQTQIVYFGNGANWNSACPETNLDGSTLIFMDGGDGHLSKHPNATIRNVNMIFNSTVDREFVLGLFQNWGQDNKPSVLEGVRIISVKGNSFISFFSFVGDKTPANLPNNAFLVIPDLTYDVAKPNQQPTKIRRSYRRQDFRTAAHSWWRGERMNPTYLWIDPKTTIDVQGRIDQAPTYLRGVEYVGASSSNNSSDIIAYRFKPTVTDSLGNPIKGVNILATKSRRPDTPLFQTVGSFRTEVACFGITGDNGQFLIEEPIEKEYGNSYDATHDSIVIQNRTNTNAYHKWWEAGTKLIIVHDTRGSTGNQEGDTYPANDFTVEYRKAGYVFAKMPLVMDKPQTPTVALTADGNYNAQASVTGIEVLADLSRIRGGLGVLNLELRGREVSLDSIYKYIVDLNETMSANGTVMTLPVHQNTSGVFKFDPSKLHIVGDSVTLVAGERLKSIQALGEWDIGGLNIAVPYTDDNRAGYINVEGSGGDTVNLCRVSDNTILRSRTGDGVIAIANREIGQLLYVSRTYSGVVIASSRLTPFTSTAGDNGVVKLYAGEQIQLAKVDELKAGLEVINRGVQRVSYFPPKRHREDI